MNVQAANKIAAQLAAVQAEWETLADLETTSERIDAALSQQAEPECGCTMRERTVGDGSSEANRVRTKTIAPINLISILWLNKQ